MTSSHSQTDRSLLHPNPSPAPTSFSSTHNHHQQHTTSNPIIPHNQQHNYVPSFDDLGLSSQGITERALFSENNTPIPTPRFTSPAPPSFTPNQNHNDLSTSPHSDIVESSSIPEWRKASPKWLYPFIIGVPLCIGMSMAPKAELYVNLACLAHPPSASQDSTSHQYVVNSINRFEDFSKSGISYLSFVESQGLGRIQPIEDSNPTLGGIPTGGDYVLSPADKWFLKLQHDMYEYRLHHNGNSTKSPSSSKPINLPTFTTSYERPEPTSPLPRPDKPFPSNDDDKQKQTPYPSDDDDEDQGDDNDKDRDQDDKDHRPYQAIDPRLCKKDVKVQAAAAKLTMVMTLTMGLLSALTTGFWGKTSDKLGRTKVIAIVELGLLLNEICFIVVANFPYLIPGGYRALLLGPTIEGLLGGYSTISATLNAYVSDVTPDGSRVTIFARIGGMFMAGFALGPVLGSLLISWTGDIMTPFYVNAVVFAIYIPLILLMLPESLSNQARATLAKNASTAREEAKKRDQLEREWEDETPFPADGTIGNFRRIFRRVFGFLEPLAIFIPVKKEGENRRDWNLTAVGAGLFFMSMVFGIMSIKAQYTFYAFGWTSAQLGPYMSITAFSRSFVLIVLVPIIMHFVKPRYQQDETSTSILAGHPTIDEEAFTNEVASTSAITTESNTASSSSLTNSSSDIMMKTKTKRSAHLDLLTVRVSLLLESIPYLLLSLSPPPIGFILLSIMTTLGGSGNPAANSLALSLLNDPSTQSGKLFGALSVLHALGANLISPLMFGTVFASTVGIYPATIFTIATCSLILAQICMSFIRLEPLIVSQKDNYNNNNKKNNERIRGRSRKIKRVNSSNLSNTSGNESGIQNIRNNSKNINKIGYGTMEENSN
uniref:Major facilitator superfamily (MFS) profile domain-containing protein n=1 Tax=Kwoniella pini CBS 10737 TaxID=1296096 RepID=A0A1B9I198_9TREE|nr:uncharacterized protein I206_05011 [Kwoniella pini CBS 10737]OCF49320.1 hypothetical protein I206_05011 [Kwoniella pini CBS 10737]